MDASTPNRALLVFCSCLVFAGVFAVTAEAKTISFKVSKQVTVVAIAKNGTKTKSIEAKGSGKITAPGKSVTLNLVDSSGSYIGPVVVGKKGGRKAIEGIKAGAKLGTLKINTKKGIVTPSKKLAKKFVDSSFTAKAKGGVPIGANNRIGLVKSSASGSSKVGNDIDHDGIVGAFDIDVNGNMVINNFDSSTSQSQASASGVKAKVDPPPGGPTPPPPPPGGGGAPGAASDSFRVFSNLKASMQNSLNANASAVTVEQINALMASTQTLAIQVTSGDGVYLNCTGLSYCSAGGTGKSLSASAGNPTSAPAFPDSATSNSDGFGLLTKGSTGDFQLLTGASSDQIGSGDAFVEVSGATELPGILNFAFITTPALTSYTTGSVSGTVTYPTASDAPGTLNNPIAVPASGDVTATLTYWRPQRQAIPDAGEGTGYVDIGLLHYVADIPNGPVSGTSSGGSSGPGTCRGTSSYSTSDPNLKIDAEGPEDQQTDQPSNPANTLTFTVNLSACLGSTAWNSGENLSVGIQAKSLDGDNAAQGIFFKRQ